MASTTPVACSRVRLHTSLYGPSRVFHASPDYVTFRATFTVTLDVIWGHYDNAHLQIVAERDL
jgi:hypothetical protein